MIELDEIKIWVFYLKKNPDKIYAYTSVKEYKDKFLEVRDPNKFRIEKLILDELELSIFMNRHRNQMLTECPFGYGLDYNEYVNLILTKDEEIELNAFASQIEHAYEDLYRELIKYKLKKKYKKSINYLLETSFEIKLPNGNTLNTSRFNMLLGFSVLFKETLKEGE